jgi:hypothetical protein
VANLFKHKSKILSGCSTIEPATGCELEAQPVSIETEPLVGTLTLGAGEQDRIHIQPQTKTTIALLSFKETNTCALAGLFSLHGSYTLSLPSGQLEVEAQAFEGLGSVENNSLELGGSKAFIEGKELLELASRSKWSFK